LLYRHEYELIIDDKDSSYSATLKLPIQ